jgi:hypothetical protein
MVDNQPGPAQVILSKKLNLVLSVDTEKGKVYIHSIPIGRGVFEDNFLVLSRAFTQIYTNGLGPVAGPRVAKLLLKQEAEVLGVWAQTQQSLLGEIYRLTSVFAPGPSGWEQMPYDVARKRGLLNDDQASEAENAIVYFTCASSIHMRAELMVALDGLKTLWDAQITSSPPTEFLRSLPTLTPAENTGEKPVTEPKQASSIPV